VRGEYEYEGWVKFHSPCFGFHRTFPPDPTMETNDKESGIIVKTLDLCQAIADQPDFQAVKGKWDAFMSDEGLKFRYQQVNDLGNLLRMKQEHGLELKPEEIEQFETMRKELLDDPVAQGFLDAQQEMQQLHATVGRFLDKTFELGRRPEFDEVHDGSCGGCGCH
jgi:cell fate (sporulation/competence/biofilm development) regulator YlbF (YheA/YmcA/DUF963 family)